MPPFPVPVTSLGVWNMIWFCPVRLEGTILTVGAGAGFWKRIFVASLTKKYKRETDLSLIANCFCVGVSLTILRNKEKANVLYNMNFAWIGQDYTSILSLLPNDTIFFSTRAHGSASRNNKDRGEEGRGERVSKERKVCVCVTLIYQAKVYMFTSHYIH